MRVLTDRAKRMLEDLPPFLHNSTDIQAAILVCANEHDRLEAAIALVRRNLFPHLADADFIGFYERVLGLSVNPPDKTLSQRQASVLAFYRRLKAATSGLEWKAALTELIGTGWTYREHDPDDGGSPPAYTLELTIPFADPLAAPASLAATPSAGGGTLGAGTYYYAVTAANFYGETTASNVPTAVLGATGHVALDWNDVAGADSYHVYRGTSPTLLKRLNLGSALTSSAYTDDGSASLTTLPPPNTNTSGSFQSREARLLASKITPAHIELTFGYEAGFLIGSSELGDTL